MSTTDTSVTNLVFNKLTLSQYKTAKAGSQIVNTESYELTDIDTAFLESSTKYAANIDVSINSSTYVITIQLKDQDGNALGNQRTIDLPLESVVVSGSYDNTNKKIVLTLQSGSTIDIPVGDLIAGLQSEITSSNKLDADLVDDSTSTNKFVTTSDKSTWSGKQDALVSGTNIKTVNNNSLLGSGNITIDSLPPQASQSGKFLTTNGTTASWANVSTEIPSQSGQSGKYLTTNGTTVSWASVDALPSQTSQSGKFLTTNGTTASWATVNALPSQSGQSGKYLTTDGTNASWETVSATSDNKSINKNASNELQAVGTINMNGASGATNPKYDWIGTLQEHTNQQVATQHPNWICYITDDTSGGESVYTKSETDNLLSAKQATLVSGTNIKTINSGSILGSGDISVYTKSETDTLISNINALTKIPQQALTYSASISLDTNKAYSLTLSGNVTFTLPSPTANMLNQIEVQIYMSTAYTVGLGTTLYFGGSAPDLSQAGYYSIMYEYDNLQGQWVVGALRKAAAQ